MNTDNLHTPYISGAHPPLHRRLIAMLYDFIVAGVSILILTAILVYLISPNETIPSNSPLSNAIFALELVLGGFYLIAFWLKKDSTLGMDVWKLKISNLSGNTITLIQGITRYLSLLIIMTLGFMVGDKLLQLSSAGSLLLILLFLALSLAWSFFDKDKLALHERLSQTKLIDTRS